LIKFSKRDIFEKVKREEDLENIVFVSEIGIRVRGVMFERVVFGCAIYGIFIEGEWI
jgi:hypothetical protein